MIQVEELWVAVAPVYRNACDAMPVPTMPSIEIPFIRLPGLTSVTERESDAEPRTTPSPGVPEPLATQAGT
jgi:hypothetical protein